MTIVEERPRSHAERQQQGLAAEIDEIAAFLEAYRDGTERPSPVSRVQDGSEIGRVAELFGLSPFEQRTLLLAAAVHLDGRVARLVSEVHDSADPRPTFGLAIAVLPDPHWDALAAGAPLRWWRLLRLAAGPTLATRPLDVDERVLHFLTGITSPEEQLDGIATLAVGAGALADSQAAIVDDLVQSVLLADAACAVYVDGADSATRLAATARFCARLGCASLIVRAVALPPPGPGLAGCVRLLDREALLSGAVPAVDAEGATDAVLRSVLELSLSPVVTVIGEPARSAPPEREVLQAFVALPAPAEQRGMWRESLDGSADEALTAAVDDVSQHYRFGLGTIGAVVRRLGSETTGDAPGRLRHLCRDRARVRLEGLAERIDPVAAWDDLVLPEGHLELLHDVVRQVRHRTKVYEEWGFGHPSDRGLGVTALFSGESGTGKTLAAEVIAGALGLDLYRIDLSTTVSKYIGETEKNLRGLFDGAEASGAVLLFDEADALFGRRGEVRDAHDRYANLEVAYLLQRMETYRGLAILTTNLRSNVDHAFLRRLRFVVEFPFPDERQRARIWRRAFPPSTPLHGVDADRLARLSVPGGSIRSIALSAAFAAAEDGSAVTPAHVLRAARAEYAKSERPLTTAELAVLS